METQMHAAILTLLSVATIEQIIWNPRQGHIFLKERILIN